MVAPLVRRVRVRKLKLSFREWQGEGRPFVLVHGLASNARTWDGVGAVLSANGHRVLAVDQRGHGLSDKPAGDYGFDDVTADLAALIEELALARPVVAGQSWGGNVVLDLAARRPEGLSGLVLVDGGFIDLSGEPGASWEDVSQRLRPPPLAGTPRQKMLERMRQFHPTWSDDQIEMQMGNFETLSDGTIRPWLSLDNHMAILRALWEQRPSTLFGRVKSPTLIAVADSPTPERAERKDREVARAAAAIPRAAVRKFEGAPHDIHVDSPEALAEWMLGALSEGFFEA